MKKLSIAFLLAVAVVACGPKDGGEPTTPMGDSAPAYSSDLKAFTVGSWNKVEMGEVNPNQTWKFKDDGTFVFHTEDDWRAEGTWTVTDEVVMLEYKTLDGLPWAEAQAKVKKEEEGGGQAAVARALGMEWVFTKLPDMNRFKVAEDKKRLEYWNGIQKPADDAPVDPNAPPDMGDLNDLMDSMKGFQLERLK